MVMVIMIASGAVVARRLDAPGVSANATIMKSGSTFKLSYTRTERSNVKVSIYNESNQLVFSETIHKISSFIRPYNFSDLPEGNYTIEITDGSSKVVKTVNYKKESSEKFVKWVPVNGSPNKYVLTVANKGTELIRINIYDSKGNLQYSSCEKITGDFAKVYDLKKISGKVLVEVADAKGNIKALSY
jgi:outer membrane lipoprotein-sorting protein